MKKLICLCTMALILAACASYPESCPTYTSSFDLSEADVYLANDNLPFQFPLEKYEPGAEDYKTSFVMSGRPGPNAPTEYHAAEDSYDPPGTPVYAMADGRVSFSGRMGGYGWLIIIDHPQANLYSLYGHLSPSRWKLESGTAVKKGDLIAYLGDPDENGGSIKNPLEPHLHFGIRAGQRSDYPKGGEWRWMAGWIKLCPQDLGWLQPSVVITSQEIPFGGYPQPKMGFLTSWGIELLLTSVYTLGGVFAMIYAVKREPGIFFISPGVIVTVAWIVFHYNGMLRTYTLFFIGIFMTVYGIFLYMRQSDRIRQDPQVLID